MEIKNNIAIDICCLFNLLLIIYQAAEDFSVLTPAVKPKANGAQTSNGVRTSNGLYQPPVEVPEVYVEDVKLELAPPKIVSNMMAAVKIAAAQSSIRLYRPPAEVVPNRLYKGPAKELKTENSDSSSDSETDFSIKVMKELDKKIEKKEEAILKKKIQEYDKLLQLMKLPNALQNPKEQVKNDSDYELENTGNTAFLSYLFRRQQKENSETLSDYLKKVVSYDIQNSP